jgi:hypothetical protein
MNHMLHSLLTIIFLAGLMVAPTPAAAQPPAPARTGVEPAAGPTGTRFAFFATGFLVDEPVAVWLNTPNGQAAELYPEDLRNANAEGVITWSWMPRPGTQPGPWEMIAQGINSRVQYVIPFEITPTTETDQLPAITAFTSARFDLMLQAQTGPVQEMIYGNGAVVLPDQVYARITTAGTNETREVIRVGPDLYINQGGDWVRVTQLSPAVLNAGLPLDEQLAQLPEYANGVVYLGQDSVRGVTTHHYQLWLTGERLNAMPGGNTADSAADKQHKADQTDVTTLPDNAVIKIDLWIGLDDQLLHQQGSVITIPARTTETEPGTEQVISPEVQVQTLVTYYDINNPGIMITAPNVP